MMPVELTKTALAKARSSEVDVIIIDTAGRLAIDDTLMTELEQVKAEANPNNILFVCDAMIGQDAVRTAAEFNRRLSFSGFVLTKLDGDARGGAALAIKEVTGKPIKFLGMGEGLDKLEDFRPEGLADRILGFGDVVGLMSDFEKVVDKDTAEKDAAKMLRGEFSFHDFMKQINMIRKMGSMRSILEKLPGMGDLMSQLPPEALDDREFKKVEAIIQSMTKTERNNPDVVNESRMERIARGSGRPPGGARALRAVQRDAKDDGQSREFRAFGDAGNARWPRTASADEERGRDAARWDAAGNDAPIARRHGGNGRNVRR